MKASSLIAASILVAVLAPVSAFAANKLDLQTTPTIAKTTQSYLVLSAFNDSGTPLESPKIIVKQTPSTLLDIGSFVSCASAEGQDLCPKADPATAGVKGIYVASVKSKEQEGKAKIDVYVNGTATTADITVGAVSQEAVKVAAQPEKTETKAAESVADVKSGGSSNGLALLVLAAFIAIGGAAYGIRKSNA